MHDFIEMLPTRFPDAKGFFRFEIKGDDLSPLLNQIKQISEQDEALFQHYISNHFPLALVASFRGKSTVEFAGHVLSRGETIRTCLGTHDERNGARRQVRAAQGRGIVLDTYTAWVVHGLGLTKMLNALFARVALPRSSIDELRDWRAQLEPESDEPLMTVGYADGRYFREEVSADRLREGAAKVSQGIDQLCNEFDIVPAAAPAQPSQLEDKLLDIARHGFLDPIYVSVSEDLLLISDDLYFRSVARELHQCEGAWVQPVLMAAHEQGVLDHTGYARAVHGLALRKHGHLSLTAGNLIEIARQDECGDPCKLQAVVAFIANSTADFESHFAVIWEFLVAVWEMDMPYLKRANAAALILEKLVSMFFRFDLMPAAYSYQRPLSLTGEGPFS